MLFLLGIIIKNYTIVNILEPYRFEDLRQTSSDKDKLSMGAQQFVNCQIKQTNRKTIYEVKDVFELSVKMTRGLWLSDQY